MLTNVFSVQLIFQDLKILNFSDVPPTGGLAARVARRDTLAMRLANQKPAVESGDQSQDSNEVASKSQAEKSAIKSNLTRFELYLFIFLLFLLQHRLEKGFPNFFCEAHFDKKNAMAPSDKN